MLHDIIFIAMVKFDATIKKFDKQGEKTGWTYIEVPAKMADQIKPGNKKSFKVKGALDSFSFTGFNLLPMGGGDFILALKADVRKAIGKGKGAVVKVKLAADDSTFILCPELVECLEDDPVALERFTKMPPSHQKYYSKWVDSAKTDITRAKRILLTVTSLSRGQDFGEMLREQKANNDKLYREK